MKPQLRFWMLIGLFILGLGIAWLGYSEHNREPLQLFPATVDRDCAPWDGPAFSITFPYDSASNLVISIWQSPDIKLPARFSVPDENGRVGNAVHLSPSGEFEKLMGSVSLGQVEQGRPIKGEFRLVSESGEQLQGQFEAEWGDETVYCG
jgi:hypothetical protein